MAAGILISILIGAIIGICSKNQMTATSISIPVMMIFAFVPMLSMFNETIEKFAKFVYSQQLSILINNIGTASIEVENVVVIGISFAAAIILFLAAFRKKGLE